MTMDQWMKKDPSIKRKIFNVLWQENPLSLVQKFGNKLNREEFEGYAPETVMFGGFSGSKGSHRGELVIYTKPQSWNHSYRQDKGVWEEIRSVATNQPIHELIDFSPLAFLIVR